MRRRTFGMISSEECRLLGCGAVWSLCEPTFRRNVSPPSSGLKTPWARNQLEQVAAAVWILWEPTFRRNVSPSSSGLTNLRARNQLEQVAADCSLARRFFNPEDGGDTFLRNVGSHKIHTAAATCSSWLLAHGFFNPEDGGDTFLRNVGSHKIYTAPHPRKLHSS
jgi:hypothetical protein